MFRALVLASAAVLVTGPVLAGSATATCSKSPASKFQPQSALEAKLKADGLTVKKIKTEKGCYEAYTVDAKGKKGTFGFNAETLEPVANAEAGEG